MRMRRWPFWVSVFLWAFIPWNLFADIFQRTDNTKNQLCTRYSKLSLAMVKGQKYRAPTDIRTHNNDLPTFHHDNR